MKLKMCNCRACKWGRKSSWEQYKIRHAKRAARHQVKVLLRQGRYDDLPISIWIPYTG